MSFAELDEDRMKERKAYLTEVEEFVKTLLTQKEVIRPHFVKQFTKHLLSRHDEAFAWRVSPSAVSINHNGQPEPLHQGNGNPEHFVANDLMAAIQRLKGEK